MKNFDLSPVNRDQSAYETPARKGKRDAADRLPSSYRSFLASSLSTIAANVPERADVSSAAILGYN